MPARKLTRGGGEHFPVLFRVENTIVCSRLLLRLTQGDLETDSAALKAQDTKKEEGEGEPTKNSM